jgi:phage shock protein A
MSSDLTIRTTTTTNTEYPLALMQNMLTVVALSNQPLQHEIQKTVTTFESFMEQMQKNFEVLSQENALLKTELIKEKTRYQESEKTHLAEIQALKQTVETLKLGATTTNNRISAVEQSQNTLQSKYSKHTHIYWDYNYKNAAWRNTHGPS